MIREHGGDQLFQRTEEIRAASVERHRNEAPVDLRLGQLDLDDTLAFVRGFGLFSMLANLAEDREGMMAAGHSNPVGRMVTGRDIARVVAFLCGPDAAMIRGQVIVVDGGYTLMG